MSQSVTPLRLDDFIELPIAPPADAGTGEKPDDAAVSKRDSLDQYHQTLAVLHKRRRKLLKLKRLGSPQYNESDFLALREYIDDFQKVMESMEEHRFRADVEQVRKVAVELLSELRR